MNDLLTLFSSLFISFFFIINFLFPLAFGLLIMYVFLLVAKRGHDVPTLNIGNLLKWSPSESKLPMICSYDGRKVRINSRNVGCEYLDSERQGWLEHIEE